MSEKDTKNIRILNADDDPMTRQLVRSILEEDGYDVTSACDGLNVFELLEKKEKPNELDCFILDIQMPRMNGIDVLSRLKLEIKTQEIPVIMLSAQSAKSDIEKSFSNGAEHYILKPFTRNQLLEGVKQVLKKTK